MARTDDVFERTASRVLRTALLAAVIGSVAALRLGWTYGVGFGVGAAFSWVNFRWLKGFVAGLGPGGNPSGFMLFFTLRYGLLAGAAYVILRYSKLSLPAMLAGLFVSPAAVIVEALILLVYERRNLDR